VKAARPKPTREAVLARELLRFAIERIAREADELSLSHRHPVTQKIEPASVADEIRENRRWLRRARKAVRR
jgi:hypothetical protein